MNIGKISLVLMTVGSLAVAVPAYADNMSGKNASAGNGSAGAVGDNPNATDKSADTCYRRTDAGDETKIVCPDNPSQSSTNKSGLTTSTQ